MTAETVALPALPEPLLEGVDWELWGQNVKTDCYTADQMRAYATLARESLEAELSRAKAAIRELVACEDVDWSTLDYGPQLGFARRKDIAWATARAIAES